MRTMLCLFAVFMLTACDGGSSEDQPKSGTTPQGGETPQAAIKGIQAAAKKADLAGIATYIVPEERALLTFGMSMMLEFLPMMGDMVGGMAEGLGGEEAAKEAKAKLDALKKKIAAVKKKHKLDKLDSAAPPKNIDPNDEEAMMREITKRLGHVDHIAFLRDASKLLKETDKKEGATKLTDKFGDLNADAMKVDGDRATIEIDGKTAEFKKVDGRWYLSLKSLN